MIKKNLKTFLSSVAATMLIIILLCGFIVVEKNTRYIAFGDNSPFFTLKHDNLKLTLLKMHFMGKDYIIMSKI